MDLRELLTSLLRGLRVGDRHQRLGLLQQLFLLREILLLGRIDLVAIGLTGVEEGVRGLTELRPQCVVIGAACATGFLPTVHQFVELAGGFRPVGGILDLIRLGDDRFLLGLGVRALVVASLRPLATLLVEGRARGGEALPQRVGIGTVDAHRIALMGLPFVEQRAELVCGRTPVRVVAQSGGDGFGLLHDCRTLLDRLGDGFLAAVREFFLLRLAVLLELLELRTQFGDIAHDSGLLGFLAQQLDRFVDLMGLDGAGVQTVREDIELFLQIEEPAGIQGECLFL